MNTKEFLNPKSMLTPGIAGATCMFLANAITTGFALTAYSPHIVLALSLLLGLLVFGDNTSAWPVRVVLYVINSLFIFAMATGSNAIGNELTGPTVEGTIPSVGLHEAGTPRVFLRTQNVDSTMLRRQNLATQITNTSVVIQAVQTQIKTKASAYNDPQQKFNTLRDINNNLIAINQSLKTRQQLTSRDEAAYLNDLQEVQHNVAVLQRALAIEENQESQRFFKPWFKKN